MVDRAELEALYSTAWPRLPSAIALARRWGSDWYSVSTPVVVRRGARVVAHVGVCECRLAVEDEPRSILAVHAVCVHPEYRGQGLGREVMERALERVDDTGAKSVMLWSEKTDFYSKFGFEAFPEHRFVAPAPAPLDTAVQPWKPDCTAHLARLQQRIRTRRPVSGVVAAADPGWHFFIDLAIWAGGDASSIGGRVALLPDHDAAMVFEVAGTTLHLHDVVGDDLPAVGHLVDVARQSSGGKIESIEFHFMPDRFQIEANPVVPADDDVLMIRGEPFVPDGGDPFALSPLTRT